MLAGTLATIIDTHWSTAGGEHRLEQLIEAFLRRSNTTILIEGPDCAKRLKSFLYAYLQLSNQVTHIINQKTQEQSDGTTVNLLKKAMQDCYVCNMKCDQLSALCMTYVQLRMVEELSSYLAWLSDYDVTLSNALVHALLEPIGVHQLDKKAHSLVENVRRNLNTDNEKAAEPAFNNNDHQQQQKQALLNRSSPQSQPLPCFSYQWGIHWCVAIGV
jgi:hypothetical protein